MNRRGGRRRRPAQRTYRLLVRLYPAAHRRAFGEQMVQTFGDHYHDVVKAGGGSRLRFWVAVLADAGASLLTEHAAELKARRRLTRRAGGIARRRRWNRHGRDSARRPRLNRRAGATAWRWRLRRRLRYRRPISRSVRVLIHTRHRQLVYRGRVAVLAVMVMLAGAGLGAGSATGHLGLSVLVAGLLVVAWLGYGMRLDRRVPAGPHGNGPAPPGGAGVREPRRPLPMSPAGSAARPRPDQDPPGPAAALV